MRWLAPSALLLALVACSEDSPNSSGPAPDTCSGKQSLPLDSMVTLQHDGVERSYLLHVPASYDGSQGVPLVLDIHGLTSNGEQQRTISGWLAKSDQEGFVLVHPNGLNASWNGGALCCGMSQQNGVDDEGFMRAIVAQLSERACIDPKRVYATGLSNGGAMSHLLACRDNDLFAATAPLSMGNGTQPCTPKRPVAVFMARATGDTLVPYQGGGALGFPSADADFEQWKTLDGCTGTPREHGLCKTYDRCEGGVEVTSCTVQTSASDLLTLGGHVIYQPANAAGAPLPDLIWEMFQRQTLP